MSQGGSLVFFLPKVHWASWMYRFMYLIKVWLVGHSFFKILLHPILSVLSLWNFHYLYVLLLPVSHRSHRLSSFLFIPLSLCSSDWIILNVFKFSDFQLWLLKSDVEILSEFISGIVIFNLESVWSLFITCISLEVYTVWGISFPWSYTIFFHNFLYFEYFEHI